MALKEQLITVQVSATFDDGKDPVQDPDALWDPMKTRLEFREYVEEEVHHGNFKVVNAEIVDSVSWPEDYQICEECATVLGVYPHEFGCPNKEK
jgi:hypothetical protein